MADDTMHHSGDPALSDALQRGMAADGPPQKGRDR